jgi:carboxyl-terminal processing protease
MSPAKYHTIIKRLGIFAIIVGVFIAGAFVGTHTAIAKLLNPPKAAADITLQQSTDLSQFWNVWGLLNKKYPFKDTTPETQDKLYGAISGLVASYGDPYTVFFPPKQAKLFNAQVKGSFGGVGMEVGEKDDAITVIAPIKDSPAEKAGVKSGDIITEIDGKKTDGMDIDTAINLIRGDIGTTVTLGVYRKGLTEIKQITITRDVVKLPTIDTEIKGDVFVISLYSFSENSAQLFTDAITKFAASGKTKLIIDLRNNPGGYLDAAVDIASYFLPSGDVIVRENSGDDHPEVVHKSKGYTLLDQQPQVAILVNGGSASASEILAGALSEHKVAKLVGTTTFGKGSVQEVIPLDDGSALKVTVAKWLTPNGVSISHQGIKPAVIVEDKPVKDPKTGKESDPQMDAALKLLK